MILSKILRMAAQKAARKTREKQIVLMLRRMAAAVNFPPEARTALRHLKLSMLSDEQIEQVYFGLCEMIKDTPPEEIGKVLERMKMMQN